MRNLPNRRLVGLCAVAIAGGLFGYFECTGPTQDGLGAGSGISPGLYLTLCGLTFSESSDGAVRYESYPGDAPDPADPNYSTWWVQQEAVGIAIGTGPCDTALHDFVTHQPGVHFEALYLDAAATHLRYRDNPPIDAELGAALATVARAMLAETSPAPRLSSFPDSLQENGSTEMMVLLRHAEQPRLWRSARGRSRAQALLTAIRFARSRWQEREEAMGGPLNRALDSLSIDVLELRPAGVIDMSDPRLLSRVVGEPFGVGFAQAGRWRYLLPFDISRAGGPEPALAALLENNGLSLDAAQRSDVRVYRHLPVVLGTSPPPN